MNQQHEYLTILADRSLTAEAALQHSTFRGKCLAVISANPEGHTLPDGVIEALSKRRGMLVMSFLTSISDKSAEYLSQHQGELILDGLASLTDVAAKHLSGHRGALSLRGLSNLSEVGARLLLRLRRDLVLCPLQLSEPVGNMLHQMIDQPTVHPKYRHVSVAATIACIESVFRDVSLGNGISLFEADAIDDYCSLEERAEAKARDERSDWRRISDQAMDACPWAHCFMDHDGLLFHLPAFMCFTLRRYTHEESHSVYSALGMIERIVDEEELRARLSNDQVSAIKRFLHQGLEMGDYWIGGAERITMVLRSFP